jgi:hypothetical protein
VRIFEDRSNGDGELFLAVTAAAETGAAGCSNILVISFWRKW